VYLGGGHQYIQIGAKVIEPFAESRSNHDVHCALAKRLGAEHPAFEMTAMELIDYSLKASGWPAAATVLEAGGHDCQPDFETSHFLNGFPTPDGKFHFAPDWSRVGPDHTVMPRFPDHMAVIEAPSAEHPFRLVTAPTRSFLNTTFNETPSGVARERRPQAKIHPGDLAALGLKAGDLVRLGNRRGSVVVHAEAFGGLQRGVVVVEGLWPNAAFVEGIGVNCLVGADAAPPNGGAAFHDTAVWVRPA
jgi:anaerobic selenocysteine-containing dehydrogenase